MIESTRPGLSCPSCSTPMRARSFERKTGGDVDLDLCFTCQGIWFDQFESLQIAPGGIVALFRLIHEHRDDLRQPLGNPLHCPRCHERLVHSMDRVKSGPFNYHRCPQCHGRFTCFAQFMIEKGFVRQLTPAEIRSLQARIGVVHCGACGAPVDIRNEEVCGHCRAPIAILDPAAVEHALASYQQAELRHGAHDPEALAEAIVTAGRERSLRLSEPAEPDGAGIVDLLISGIEILGDWLQD